MKREFSAGGIVFKTVRSQGSGDSQVLNKQGQVLLTQHSSNKHWGFPKGWIQEGESSKEAAVREVQEEGGVSAEIITKVEDQKYVYTHPETKEKIFKIVTYYLMRYISGDPQNHDWEVSEAGWFYPEEALQKIDISANKSLLKKTLEIYGKL